MSMTTYQTFGFVNTKGMLKSALAGNYAVPGYNFNNLEQMQAIIIACLESQSPVILQVSKGARDYADQDLIINLVKGAVPMMKRLVADANTGAKNKNAKNKKGRGLKNGRLKEISIALHLDHGEDFAICKWAIDSGFSSVMIDGSYLPYNKNIALTKKVVAYARQHGVTVEGELGVLAGQEGKDNKISAARGARGISYYTDPAQAEEFVKKTGVDSLAVAIGTSHGAYKFTVKQKPQLRLDILKLIKEKLPGFPIVLHGASSVLLSYTRLINKYGGNLDVAVGIPESQIKQAVSSAVCKVNIDTDTRLVVTASVRKYLAQHKEVIDPRLYLGFARAELIKMYKRKNKEVLNSAGRV